MLDVNLLMRKHAKRLISRNKSAQLAPYAERLTPSQCALKAHSRIEMIQFIEEKEAMKTILRSVAILLTVHSSLASQALAASAAAESPLAPGAHVCGGVGRRR